VLAIWAAAGHRQPSSNRREDSEDGGCERSELSGLRAQIVLIHRLRFSVVMAPVR